MPKYDVIDEGFVDAQPIVVYNAVLDELAGITHWGPPNVSTKLRGHMPLREGSSIDSTIHEKGLTTKFSFKVTKIEEGKAIEYDVAGDSMGTGKWRFEPFEGKTKVQFLFNFRTNKLLFSILSPFVDFGKGHSDIMQKQFKACNSYLCNM
jgi:hypothetical protein